MARRFNEGLKAAVDDIQDPARAEESEQRLLKIRYLAAVRWKEILDGMSGYRNRNRHLRFVG